MAVLQRRQPLEAAASPTVIIGGVTSRCTAASPAGVTTASPYAFISQVFLQKLFQAHCLKGNLEMQHPKTRGGITGSNTKSKTTTSKAIDQRWQRAPIPEKKRVGRVPELETQLARLQEELNKTKDQLSEAESRIKQANHEAEEAKKQLAAKSAKLEESQKQLDELWACEQTRIHELRKISQDRDRAWEAELKAIQKHLATAITENQKLNVRLQKVAESEADYAKQAESAQLELSETVNAVEELKIQLTESKDELQAVQEHLATAITENQKLIQKVAKSEADYAKQAESAHLELSETVNAVEELKIQLTESKDSESQALDLVNQTREQLKHLETVKLSAVEELKIQLTESKDSESRALDLVNQTREQLEQLELVKLNAVEDENGEPDRDLELAAALAACAEMEGELRRMKVQTEQWRKAAEVAAAMVLGDGGGSGGRGKLVSAIEFSGGIGEKSNSSFSEDTEDESSMKKTGNMLKKIGVLLKKAQK
ncbi:hypothetical protein SSX86_000964 [Deinandra increscens subsp. villosa]|uniref:Uncharacterized protein n=1 Tax=Deinandra increscens subsp. villosa TaxID=3103831 RepID=A0AAP0DU44_9ASTR